MRVILDNGHGDNTAGKRSPKGMLTEPERVAFFEYEFNRDIVHRIAQILDEEKIRYDILVPEDHDVSLRSRVDRANDIYNMHKDAFLISVHANAGGGTGWEVFTSVGQTKSDEIATVFCEVAAKSFPEFRMRFDNVDGDPDKESQFYILRNTRCPAILTENFFMDHKKDLGLLITDEFRQRIAEMHVVAIKEYSELMDV